MNCLLLFVFILLILFILFRTKENFFYDDQGMISNYRIFDAKNNRIYFLRREHKENILE
jgi:hypothetical protein